MKDYRHLEGKPVFMLRYLPFLEGLGGVSSEEVLGIVSKGAGSIEEVFETREEAETRKAALQASFCVERLELIHGILGRFGGTLIDYWTCPSVSDEED